LIRKIKFILLLCLGTACSPSIVRSISDSEIFGQNHTGFYLYDPQKDNILIDINGDKYFTPASNTKIFTFYTSLRILGDSIPGLRYIESGDSLIVWGTGDPSLFNPELPEGKVAGFLKSSGKNIFLSTSNFYDEKFGPGWAWDDFPYDFQPEKSALPVYGNVMAISGNNGDVTIVPGTFEKYLYPSETRKDTWFKRSLHSNLIHYSIMENDTVDVNLPFIVTKQILTGILEDTLNRKITFIDRDLPGDALTIYSTRSDSVYKQMMHMSDNFIAEQLMLVNAGVLSDSLKSSISISYSIDSLLNDLPDPLIWRDGSGLSRYNLFTPRTIVALWVKISELLPKERLYKLIPAGGVSGTLENWYKSDHPYIYGKTGTLSNNHCLSGFIVTKSGNTLVFSFMNNNYRYSSSTIKYEMESILKEVYEKY